jgi:hypothetical protein
MATLTGSTIADTYTLLLKVDNTGIATDGTLRKVEDGDATDSALSLSDVSIAVDATDKIFLDGGSDTYIYESGADVLDIYVGGANMIKLTESTTDTMTVTGALTIGSDGSGHDVIFYSDTTGDNFTWDSSAEKLTITGTNGATALDIADGNLVVADSVDIEGDIDVNGTANLDNTDIDGTFTQDAGNVVFNEDSGDYDFRVESNGNANMLFVDGGNDRIGIGVGSSPLETLHVDTSIRISDNETDDTNKSSYITASQYDSGSQAEGFIAMRTYAPTGVNAVRLGGGHSSWNAATEVTFYTAANETTATGTERMRINSAGNVGIGVSDPDQKLEVKGIVKITHGTTVTDYLTIQPYDDGFTYFDMYGTGGSGEGGYVFRGNSNSTTLFKIDPNSRISLSNNDSGTSNTIFGKSAGLSLDAGSNYNVFIGEAVSDASMNDATKNVGVGYNSLSGLTEGDHNVVIGNEAANDLTVGDYNTFIGSECADALTQGDDNVAIGYSAMGNASTTDGIDKNVFIGNYSGDAIGSNAVEGVTAVGYASASGALTSAANNSVAIGREALKALTSGAANTAVGYQSGLVLTTGGNNTALGHGALLDVIDGAGNVAIGSAALGGALGTTADSASYNIAIGYGTMGGTFADTQTNHCVAIGTSAMDAALDNVDGTVAIGSDALGALTSGAGNVAIGYQAGDDLTDGAHNTILGYQAGDTLLSGTSFNVIVGSGAMGGSSSSGGSDYNVAVGYRAMGTGARNNADNNVAVGRDALLAITTGTNNVVIGSGAGVAMTTAASNVVIGKGAFQTADAGENWNIVIGQDAGGSINHANSDSNILIGVDAGTGGAAAMIGCIAIGKDSMNSTAANAQTGTIAIGSDALTALTDGEGNLAVGYQAMAQHVDGHRNVAIGYQAMYQNAGSNAANSNDNIFIGYQAGAGDWGNSAETNINIGIGTYALDAAMDGALYNIAIGKSSLSALTEADYNTAIGYTSGEALTTGAYNTMMGSGALKTATTATYNAAFGKDAMGSVKAGVAVSSCVAVGYAALEGNSSNTTGINGTVAIGFQSLNALTTGGGNTAVGYQALSTLSTTSSNTVIGYQAGQDCTGHHNTIIGRDAGKEAADVDSCVIIGSNTALGVLESGADGTVAIGYGSLGALVGGAGITAVGYKAGEKAISDNYSTFIGYGAGKECVDGGRNTVLGYGAMTGTQAGGTQTTSDGSQDNTFLGAYAGGGDWANTTSNNNVAIGSLAMDAAMEGCSDNVAVGYGSLGGLVGSDTAGDGDRNTAVGRSSAGAVTTGTDNTIIGFGAATTDLNLTTGDENTVIGTKADISLADAQNQIVIGYAATGQGDDKAVIGNADITDVYMAQDSGALVHCAGIQFPATFSGNAGANVLDEYEEGTWTPTITFADSGSVGYSQQVGTYTRVGNLVMCAFDITVNSESSASGNARLDALPFTAKNVNARPALNIGYLSGWSATAAPSGGYIEANATRMNLMARDSADARNNQTTYIAGAAGTERMIGSFTYLI